MMQNSTDKKHIDMDQRNNPLMTLRTVMHYCNKESLPQKPKDIDTLYLQYKGFQRIIAQTLISFPILKILHLNNNGITRIQGLDKIEGLTHLYLQNNFVQRIEGLEGLRNLVCLNLAHNKIDVVEGLGKLESLKILNLAENFIESQKGIQGLLDVSSLSQLNLSQNDLQASQEILEILTKLNTLTHLFLKSTPISSNLKSYRKRIVSKLKNLIFLDNQPIFPTDHLLAQAWVQGGQQRQAQVKSKIAKERIEKEKIEFEQGMKKGQQKLKEQEPKLNSISPIVYENKEKASHQQEIKCKYLSKIKQSFQGS